MLATQHLTMEQLEAGLPHIRQSPKELGTLKLVVRRPTTGEREVLAVGELDVEEGLVGDNWKMRGSKRTDDGSAHPDMQLNVMNARVVNLIAQERERWQLAGDQLFVDLDLSEENVPPGTQLRMGTAVIEITAQPHTGCKKFVQRFGRDAVIFVNSPEGKKLHLRGINAKVVQPGLVRPGDEVIVIRRS